MILAAIVSMCLNEFAGTASCGSNLTLAVPIPASAIVERARILELAVNIPPGVVVEISNTDGASLGSISPFGRSGPGIYQIVVADLLREEGTYKIVLKAFHREAGNADVAPVICVERARFLSL